MVWLFAPCVLCFCEAGEPKDLAVERRVLGVLGVPGVLLPRMDGGSSCGDLVGVL